MRLSSGAEKPEKIVRYICNPSIIGVRSQLGYHQNSMKSWNPHSSELPSGKHTKNYGKSRFLMGQVTISMTMFHSFLLVYQRVIPLDHHLLLNVCEDSELGHDLNGPSTWPQRPIATSAPARGVETPRGASGTAHQQGTSALLLEKRQKFFGCLTTYS